MRILKELSLLQLTFGLSPARWVSSDRNKTLHMRGFLLGYFGNVQTFLIVPC